jgi:hypothetical protein
MKNKLPPCAHFHSRVFLILPPSFLGYPGGKKEKEKEKEKPVQPFMRPRTLLAKFGLTTG